MSLRRQPVLLLLLALVCALTGCSGSGHHRFRPRALSCRLQTAGRRADRAVVTYDDETGNSAMSSAISSEVAEWNASSAPVELVASKSQPAITFRAVPGASTPLPPCQGTAPRMVTVNLSTPKWAAPAGAAHAVKDPVGAIAKLIAHALGLASGGTCPQITSNKACLHRRTIPGRTENAILQRLYGTVTATATPT